MKFEIVGKNVSITEAMRQKIERKLSFLDKYLLIDPETRARVVVRTYPLTQKIEVTIPTKVGILRTEVEHEDLYAAIDLAIDKLEDQVRRQKTRLSRRHREKLALSFVEQDNVKLDQGDIASEPRRSKRSAWIWKKRSCGWKCLVIPSSSILMKKPTAPPLFTSATAEAMACWKRKTKNKLQGTVSAVPFFDFTIAVSE